MTTSIRHFDNREALLALLTSPGRYPIEVPDVISPAWKPQGHRKTV